MIWGDTGTTDSCISNIMCLIKHTWDLIAYRKGIGAQITKISTSLVPHGYFSCFIIVLYNTQSSTSFYPSFSFKIKRNTRDNTLSPFTLTAGKYTGVVVFSFCLPMTFISSYFVLLSLSNLKILKMKCTRLLT